MQGPFGTSRSAGGAGSLRGLVPCLFGRHGGPSFTPGPTPGPDCGLGAKRWRVLPPDASVGSKLLVLRWPLGGRGDEALNFIRNNLVPK